MHSDENVLDENLWVVWQWRHKQKQKAEARRNRLIVGSALCLLVLGFGIWTSLVQ